MPCGRLQPKLAITLKKTSLLALHLLAGREPITDIIRSALVSTNRGGYDSFTPERNQTRHEPFPAPPSEQYLAL